MQQDEQLQGAIERITYYNEENGYSVLRIKPEKRIPRAQARDGTVTVVGIMPELIEGESAQFTGEWINDPRYGLQFRAQQAIPVAPNTEKGIVAYLSSGLVRGIGPRTAEKIYGHFGEDTIKILDTEPERIHASRQQAIIRYLSDAGARVHVKTPTPQKFFDFPNVSYHNQRYDIGLIQPDSLTVDVEATFQWYREFLKRQPALVAEEVTFIHGLVVPLWYKGRSVSRWIVR